MSRGRRAAWAVGWVLAAILLAVGLAFNFPGAVGIERLPVISALIGPRNAVTVGAAAVLGVFLILCIIRPLRPVAVPLMLAMLVSVGLSGWMVVSRGLVNESPSRVEAGQLRILSWNTNGDLVTPTVIAQLAARVHANLIVLPDIPAASGGSAYEQAFAAAGVQVHPYPVLNSDAGETIVFVAPSLGSYSEDVVRGPQPDRSVKLTPTSAGLPTIVAIHAAHPTQATNALWKRELTWVAAQCSARNVIAVGDFNGTVDSFGGTSLGRCEDAAVTRGVGSVGTWPTTIPTWAAMPLDHILVSPGWKPTSFSVITSEDHSGARHRPIMAVLTPSS